METLPPPMKRYLMGAWPAYASRRALPHHFQGVPPEVVQAALEARGLLEEGKATAKAREEGYVASCEGKLLWSVAQVEALLVSGGMKIKRAAQNQEVVIPLGEPEWANLGTIGTYFQASAVQVGKWLDELSLREDGAPTEDSRREGLVRIVEMNAGGKKTRSVAHWNLHLVKQKLVEAGHVLDFSYEETMKGKGRNSDVAVSGAEERARELFLEWRALYQNPKTREASWRLFAKQPKGIIERVEALLKRPRYIQDKKYLKQPWA